VFLVCKFIEQEDIRGLDGIMKDMVEILLMLACIENDSITNN